MLQASWATSVYRADADATPKGETRAIRVGAVRLPLRGPTGPFNSGFRRTRSPMLEGDLGSWADDLTGRRRQGASLVLNGKPHVGLLLEAARLQVQRIRGNWMFPVDMLIRLVNV